MGENDFYKNMIENLYDGVYFVDRARKITFWNKGAERISGFTKEDVLNSHCYDNILNHIDVEGNYMCFGGCPLQATIQDGQNRETEAFLLHKEGHRVPIFVRTVPIESNGEVVGAVEIFADNSERLEVIHNMKKLEMLAMTDELCGLPNRRYGREFITSKLHELRSLDIPFGLAFLDIDNFKDVNDTYGHDVGDEVIKLIARTSENALRKSDMFVRWGGEEFVVIFIGIDHLELAIVTEKLRLLIERSSVRIPRGKDIRITVSIGATLASDSDTIDSLVDRADQLMYQSKIDGKNRTTLD